MEHEMREGIILASVIVVAVASVLSALCLVWISAKVSSICNHMAASRVAATNTLRVMAEEAKENKRIVDDTNKTIHKVDSNVNVAKELGFQARASDKEIANNLVETLQASTGSLDRIEQLGHDTKDRDAVVATDLSDARGRADAMPKDGNYGAAADAALRNANHDVSSK